MPADTDKRDKTAIPGATRPSHFSLDPWSITIIGLDTHDGEEHPLYDERIHKPLSEAWVKHLMVDGVHTPIHVRKDGDRLLCIAGRRRVRGLREANKRLEARGEVTHKIPAMAPMRGSDGDVVGRMIDENEQREDDTVLAKARKCSRYMERGKSVEDAGLRFGVTEWTITHFWLKLLDLDDSIQGMIERDEISANAAVLLAGLSRAEQKAKIEAIKEARARLVALESGADAETSSDGPGDGGPFLDDPGEVADGAGSEGAPRPKARPKKAAPKGTITAKEVERAKKGEDLTKDAPNAPSRAMIRKVLAQGEADEPILDMLRWVLGQGKPPKNHPLRKVIDSAERNG